MFLQPDAAFALTGSGTILPPAGNSALKTIIWHVGGIFPFKCGTFAILCKTTLRWLR